MDDRGFDAYVKALVTGGASRRLFAAGLLAGAVTSMPVIGGGLDALAGRRPRRRKHKKHRKPRPLSCSGDSCDGTGGKPCGGRDDCQCYLAASGGNVCASSLQSSLEVSCETNRDCPRRHVCVAGGPACGGRDLRFCKAACYK